jgi:methylmalonyl-CoA mutase C-terminal domain/subunit
MSQPSTINETASGVEGGRKIRVLIAKPGLDGHDRGAKVVTRGLRDAGMEVIYTGLHQTPEMIVEAALQEDVDAIGLSILSGAHIVLFPRIMKLLADNGMEDVIVFAGGIIPPEDEQAIRDMGIKAVFGPGTPIEETANFLRQNARPIPGLIGEGQ